MNYSGPGNPICNEYRNKYPPVNKVDEAALYHDYAFTKYAGDPTHLREADIKLLDDLKNINPLEKGWLGTKVGIESKIILENNPILKNLIPKSHRGNSSNPGV